MLKEQESTECSRRLSCFAIHVAKTNKRPHPHVTCGVAIDCRSVGYHYGHAGHVVLGVRACLFH